jgi:hypothetical protein
MGPIVADENTAARPKSHRSTSTASGMPCSGIRPVQFGIAVSRNPATVAAANPKTISCACQRAAGSVLGTVLSPLKKANQSGIARADHSAEAKKNGRNPAESKAGP